MVTEIYRVHVIESTSQSCSVCVHVSVEGVGQEMCITHLRFLLKPTKTSHLCVHGQ